MNFSQEECRDMIYVLGASDKNCLLAKRIYCQKYPERRQPRKETFENVMHRFDETFSVSYKKTERSKSVTNEENEFAVLLSVTENPYTSSRAISKELDISTRSVRRILKKNRLHPYHIQLLQELNNTDYEKRLTFCMWAQEKRQQERDFFNFVLFTDEATFHKNGNVNRHNFHYYATENPFLVRTHSQIRWSLNVWGGIVGNHIIGPFFFDGILDGHKYLQFLENDLEGLLENVPLNIRRRMWFQHDGAPVHQPLAVRNYLNNEFPERWIGRGGPISWPPRSPDLTKMDFFLWGYIKNLVYRIPTTTKEDMKN